MLELLKLKPESFGLNISDRSIKIAKLKKKREVLSLASFGEFEMKPGIIEEGEIKDQKALIEAIKLSVKKIKGEKLRTNYVVASLPEEKAFLQVIQLPILEEKELKDAVYYEAENHIPLLIGEVYLDSQTVKPVVDHLDHSDVLIAAMPKKIVDPYLVSIKKAGLIPKILETESQAISRALIENEVSPFPVLIIDIGLTKTCFIIFSGYSLRFTSSIPISSQKISDVLSTGLGISIAEAEDLKTKAGLSQDFHKKREDGSEIVVAAKRILEIADPLMVDLVNRVKSYLGYYQSYVSHEHLSSDVKEVKKILLCGDGASFKGLDDFLSVKLKIPVEIANPWINILPEFKKEIPELSFDKSLSFATALGLGLRALKENQEK
jgi:type IV pilus assembly protein PilM